MEHVGSSSRTELGQSVLLSLLTIQLTESVPRVEAICRMQRRKEASGFSVPRVRPGQETRRAALRLCRNPRCGRGDDGGPASLQHLRVDACIVTPFVKRQVREFLIGKIAHQIASVHAGLRGTNLSPWHTLHRQGMCFLNRLQSRFQCLASNLFPDLFSASGILRAESTHNNRRKQT
jgi:hypothetical protein